MLRVFFRNHTNIGSRIGFGGFRLRFKIKLAV